MSSSTSTTVLGTVLLAGFPTAQAGYDLFNLEFRLHAIEKFRAGDHLASIDLLAADQQISKNKISTPIGFCEKDAKVKQASGVINFEGYKKQAKSFFFWMFESRSDPFNDPLVVWLTGGPGCSGMLAVVVENGPCTLLSTEVVDGGGGTTTSAPRHNPYSWTSNANVIWLDQPVGTGWSTGASIGDEHAVGHDFYGFMLAFYEEFPQYKTNPFFITGESYAGHYIPAVAHQIMKENKEDPKFKIPLKGVAIGNGSTQPTIQNAHDYEMATTGGQDKGGSMNVTKGLVQDEATKKTMQELIPKCLEASQLCNTGVENAEYTGEACAVAAETCAKATTEPWAESTGHNFYDMRIPCEVPGLCYDFSSVEAFYNDEKTRQALGVSEEQGVWTECAPKVMENFMLDLERDYHFFVAKLLDGGVDVLIYNGDCDYICNWLGNKAWVQALSWKGKRYFNDAADMTWKGPDGKDAGRLRKYENLHFLQIYQAGHMVPMDQPAVALYMLNGFLAGNLVSPPPLPKGVPVTAPPHHLVPGGPHPSTRSTQEDKVCIIVGVSITVMVVVGAGVVLALCIFGRGSTGEGAGTEDSTEDSGASSHELPDNVSL